MFMVNARSQITGSLFYFAMSASMMTMVVHVVRKQKRVVFPLLLVACPVNNDYHIAK